MAIKSKHRIGKSRKDTVKKMGRGSNFKDWIGKVGRTDPKKWESLTLKMRRTDPKNGKVWLEKSEGLTQKKGKDGPVKVEMSDSKNEKGWLGEELTRKMRRSEYKHGKSESKQGRSNSKTRQVWFVKRRSCWPKKWKGLTLNTESLSQNSESPIQKQGRSDSKKEGLVDTSQSS